MQAGGDLPQAQFVATPAVIYVLQQLGDRAIIIYILYHYMACRRQYNF